MKMKRGKRGAARSKFYRPQARRDSGGRRDNHRERGGAAKVAERGEKIRLCRTSRRCANFPVCPPTSATGHPAAAHFRGRARELNPPAATIPFFKISLGAGRPMKRPTSPHFPAAAIPFLRFRWGAGRPMKRPTVPRFPAVAKTFLRFLEGVRGNFLARSFPAHLSPTIPPSPSTSSGQ